jgi:hypothetical protein
MVRSLTPVGTGTSSSVSFVAQAHPAVLRGSPFETEIGVGKVIKGWDEGALSTSCIPCSVLTLCAPGVPQLSVGTKAILTASPDYVSCAVDCRYVRVLM